MSGAQYAKRQSWYRNLRQRPGKGSLRVREAPTRLAEEVKSYGIGSKNGPVTGAAVARAAPLAAYAVPAIAAVGLASVGLSYAATERANLAGGIRGVKRGRVVEAADLTAEDRAIIALANKPKSQLAPPAAFNVKESQDGDAPEGFFSQAGSAILRTLPVAYAGATGSGELTNIEQLEFDTMSTMEGLDSLRARYRDAKDAEEDPNAGPMARYNAATILYRKASSRIFAANKKKEEEEAVEAATKDYKSKWAPKEEEEARRRGEEEARKRGGRMGGGDDEGEVVMGGMGGNTTNTTPTDPTNITDTRGGAGGAWEAPSEDDRKMAMDAIREMKAAIEAEVEENPHMDEERMTEIRNALKPLSDRAKAVSGAGSGDSFREVEKLVQDTEAVLDPRKRELQALSASASGTDFLGFPTAEKDVVKNQQERMSALRPFLPHAGTEVFDEQETAEADARKIQNLTMGMAKPQNFPLGNVSNKFWLQNMAREGMLLSDPLYDMPVIYQGSTINEGATLYGVEEMSPDVRGVEQGVVQNRFHKAQSLLSPAWNSGRRLRKTM